MKLTNNPCKFCYVVYFVGQTHSRSICEMDMADIRRELEKIVIQKHPEEK